jgi:hypothetical protein
MLRKIGKKKGISEMKIVYNFLNGMTQLVVAEINGDIKINTVDLGWLSTDMGGPSAPRTQKKVSASIYDRLLDPKYLMGDSLDVENE